MLALTSDTDDLISQLYDDMYKKLVMTAYTRLRNYQAAEDIVQDVFALAQEKRVNLLLHPNPGAWLFDVLKKKLMHELRSMTRFKAMLAKLEVGLTAELSAETASIPDRFDHLTEKEYNVLRTIYIDGSTIRMVAEKLGLSYETCRRHVQKTKDKIRIRSG